MLRVKGTCVESFSLSELQLECEKVDVGQCHNTVFALPIFNKGI